MGTTLTRREFLKRSLVGAGLTVAVAATPAGLKLLSAEELEKERVAGFTPNVWLRITPDNIVTVVVNKSDLEAKARMDRETVDGFCRDRGHPWSYASAKTGTGVEEAFEGLVRRVLSS